MTVPRYETPKDAERAFYAAFQSSDLEAMNTVWADDDDIVCVHPMGPRLQGREAVMSSWGDILGSGAALSFRVDRIHVMTGEDVSVHCVHENITQGSSNEIQGLVIATNVYRKTAEGWRMVLHHGSPGTAESAREERPRVVH